jgi:hypothetical protein
MVFQGWLPRRNKRTDIEHAIDNVGINDVFLPQAADEQQPK